MKRKILPLLTPILFFGFLSVLLVWALVKPAGVSSGAEGRALAQKPVKDLTDLPALIERCNDYVADQFPMRETLLKLDSAAQIYTGKRLIRGITVDAEGYLLPQLYRADPAQRDAMVFALDDQVQALPQVDFVYAVLPQKNTMLDSPLLDGRISKANHQALCEALRRVNGLHVLDLETTLTARYSLNERRDFYYRTDFHWNDRGAFRAAEALAAGMQEQGLLEGVTLPTEADFSWDELGGTHRYLGDLNRRFSYLFPTQEGIPHYTLTELHGVQYFAGGDTPVARETLIGSGLANPELDYNKISTYNLGFYRVCNPNARSAHRVLILKDSLQNPTTDYFTELFSEVVVVDLRSYEEPYDLNGLIAQYDLDTVLLMFHQNNISAELTSFLLQ